MKLSPNFSLSEFTASSTAARLKLDNTPPESMIPTLIKTAYGMEEVRTLLMDSPIHVTSAYRSPEVNKAIGSRPTSQHTRGEAVDFVCPLYGTPRSIVEKIVSSDIGYDQVISERSASGSTWCHISFADRNRKQALSIDANGVRSFA